MKKCGATDVRPWHKGNNQTLPTLSPAFAARRVLASLPGTATGRCQGFFVEAGAEWTDDAASPVTLRRVAAGQSAAAGLTPLRGGTAAANPASPPGAAAPAP